VSIYSALTAKPWESSETLLATSAFEGTPTAPLRVGLRFFLVIVSILFFMLIVAYAGRLSYEDWRPLPAGWLMWLNTLILIGASLVMQGALVSARRYRWRLAKLGLEATGGLTIIFLFSQIYAWRQLLSQNMFEVTNPAIALFLLITGLHGLHLLGGLWVWLRATNKLWQGGDLDQKNLLQSIELSATYWHFMLAIWLVLFGLLFSSNDNLDILLTICGLK
jgi:cytochrome c oxidase subunit 3